tara:strand:- start:2763 stop:4604 length:1842 start_codon:yes stop_codon:yes gene_type:complete
MAVDPNKLFGRNIPKSSRTDNQRSATSGSKDAAGSFLSLNKNIFAINKNLTAIADLITKQAKQEKDADKLDAEARKKREDDEKKKNAESVLEKIVSNTVIKPLQSIKKGLGNIFERIFKALGSLFAGYVGMKGIDGIQDWLKGDKSTLTNLAKEVGLVLTAAGGVFLAMNVGIPLISSALGTVVGNVVSGLPGVLGLLGNPMVWMGIIAAAGIVYSGTMLYKYLSGEFGADGSIDGRGSYSNEDKFYIDRVVEVGQEETLNEIDRKMAKLAERYPALFTEKNGKLVPKDSFTRKGLTTFDGSLAAANNDLQDMLDTRRYIGMGKYDRFDAAKLSKEDQMALNQIMPLIEKAKNNWSLFKGKQLEITALLDGQAYSELSSDLQKIADKLYEEQVMYKSEIVGAMKQAKGIEKGMSGDGKDFLNAIAQKNNIRRLFERSDGWNDHLVVGPHSPNDTQKLDVLTMGMKKSAIEHFDKIIGVDSDIDRIVPKALKRAGFDPEKISPTFDASFNNNSLSKNTEKVEGGIKQNDIFASGNLFSNKNLEVASKFSSSLDTPNFEIVPVDFTGDSSSGAVTETFTPQDYDPAMYDFATSNLANDDYISLFSSQIGIYDYDN